MELLKIVFSIIFGIAVSLIPIFLFIKITEYAEKHFSYNCFSGKDFFFSTLACPLLLYSEKYFKSADYSNAVVLIILDLFFIVLMYFYTIKKTNLTFGISFTTGLLLIPLIYLVSQSFVILFYFCWIIYFIVKIMDTNNSGENTIIVVVKRSFWD